MVKTLTAVELEKEPPAPFLRWSEGAMKRWLENKGFDLKRQISRATDARTGNIIFSQHDGI